MAVKTSWIRLSAAMLAWVGILVFVATMVFALQVSHNTANTANNPLVFAGDGGDCGSKKTSVCNKKGECHCVSNEKGCEISGDKTKCPPPKDNTGGIVTCENSGVKGGKGECAVNLSNNKYVECAAGSPGAVTASCRLNDKGECYSPGDGAKVCGNSKSYCPKNSCSCKSTKCPPANKPTKFMTNPVPNGTHATCGTDSCVPTQVKCDPSYKNNAPTCAMLPKTITMNRSDAPRALTLTVTDKDYGDTVQVTNVRIVDTAGRLRSCVKVTNTTGQELYNLVVKPGSSNAADITSVTNLLVDASTAHGLYLSNDNGTSSCSGSLEVSITDLDLDGNGPDTSTPGVKCKVAINVINRDPVISNIQVLDKDPQVDLRRSGNLLTQVSASNPLFVGSPWDARRVSTCASALSLSNPGDCPTGSLVPQKTRTNPFEVDFTVRDGNGISDLKDIGIFLQRTTGAKPLTAGGFRYSAESLLSTRRDFTISGANFYNTDACLGANCTDSLLGDNALQLGYTLIRNKGPQVGINGNISASAHQNAGYRAWLAVGFPDCLGTAQGCSLAGDVPAAAKALATVSQTDNANFDWMIAADASHMVCMPSAAPTAYVIAKSSTCPANCAACISRESVTQVTGDPNAVNVKFTVYMNDKNNGGAGMVQGAYNLLVGAEDKVGGRASGDNFWLTATSAPIVFDTTPPTIDLNLTNPAGTANMVAAGTLSDSSSGVAGYTSRFLLREHYLNAGDASGIRSFLTWDTLGTNLIDGKSDIVSFARRANTTFTFTGHGVETGDGVASGVCAYDAAGNMCCAQTIGSQKTSTCQNFGTSGIYTYGGGWIETSLGSVYSNTATTGAAFNMTVPATSANTSSLVYAPFSVQSGSSVTGFLISGSGDSGLIGGRTFGGDPQTYPLGFSSNSTHGYFRTGDANSPFNIFTLPVANQNNWYAQIKGIATTNCQLIGGGCQAVSDIVSGLGASANYKIGTITSSQTISDHIVCRGSSIIFIDGNSHVTITGQVTKDTPQSACLFVVNSGSTLTIGDLARAASTGAPQVDAFQASIIVSNGGTIETTAPETLQTGIVFDRLELYGFLFSASSNPPVLQRSLNNDNNKLYPAEWFIYDANVLDAFRPLLGFQKTVDLVCGTSGHVFCTK